MGPLQLGPWAPLVLYFATLTSYLHSRFVGLHTRVIVFSHLCASIGLDTCLSIQQVLYTGTGDSKYRPSVLLERMVDAQWLGKKNGKGFYDYPPE
jgi:hypothetical protein